MTTDVYIFLLGLAGTIIVILAGVIISASLTLFKNVNSLLTRTENIQTLLSERNSFCLTRHERIDRSLAEHSIILTRHSEDITTLKAKLP